MKAFLETSVLVPVFYGDHPHHTACLDLFVRYPKTEASCAAHSLVEVYSVLTRMTGKHRVGPDQAMLFIGSIREKLTLVSLDGGETADALAAAAALGIAGGTIYDAMLAHCALKANAEALYTCNTRHFAQFGPEVAKRLRMP